MFQSILDDVKREFSYGNMVTRIIIVNIAVFVLINLVNLILFLANGGQPSPLYRQIMEFFMMPSDGLHFLTHPWSIITSMFMHEGFWHLLWNMLMMYWFGRIVGDFIGNQRILPLYLLGGIAGGIMFFITANVLPFGAGGSFALGASAGVMATVVAAGVIAPDYIMRLLLIGDVKLKYIVMVLVLLDVFALASSTNTGGHFAHLGGVLMGWLFVRQLQEGNDWSRPVNNFMDGTQRFFANLFGGSVTDTRKKGPRMAYRNPDARKTAARHTKTTVGSKHSRGHSVSDDATGGGDHQERLDAILDKIKRSGYDSLSEEEKEFLFNASKK